MYYPLYAEAERLGIIAAISGGGLMGPDYTYVNPIAIQRVARDFPGLTPIMCHGGWPWYIKQLQLLTLAPTYMCPRTCI